jgi:hypothetical protein
MIEVRQKFYSIFKKGKMKKRATEFSLGKVSQLKSDDSSRSDGEGADGPEHLEGRQLKTRREHRVKHVLDTGPLQPDAERIDGDDGDVATHATLQVGRIFGGLKFNLYGLFKNQTCTAEFH